MDTIKDIEVQAEQNEKLRGALKEIGLLPDGYRLSVRLHAKSRNKRRSALFEKNWSADSDSIRIGFEPVAVQLEASAGPAGERAAAPSHDRDVQEAPAVRDHFPALIQALDRAESRPGFGFVALKWFRDTVLPQEGFAWAAELPARHAVLRDAIERRLILTSKEPNPKSPQFPVTAIRLNRLMPEVAAILGNEDKAPGFRPIPIRGENLSSTVLHDRR